MWLFIQLKQIKKVLRLVFIIASLLLLAVAYINIRYPLKYINIVKNNSMFYKLDPALICAIIRTESSFKRDALSHKGASGLMQITETTGNWIAEEMELANYHYDRIFEPDLNIKIGCYYIDRLLKQYGDDLTLALAAYNAGSGNVSKWLNDPKYSTDGKTLDNIPFPETRNYIQRINSNMKAYKYLLKVINIFT